MGMRSGRTLQVMARTLDFIFGKTTGELESFEQGSDIIEFAFSKKHFGSWVEFYERERGLGTERP